MIWTLSEIKFYSSMGKNKHKVATKLLSGLSAEEWSDTSHGSQSGAKNPSSHDKYIKDAKEFQDTVAKSSLDSQRILESCSLNGQLTVRIKSYAGNPASFPFDALTNIASDGPGKERIIYLIHRMRAAVTPSAITYNSRLAGAPSTIVEGESAEHDFESQIANLQAEVVALRAQASKDQARDDTSGGNSHGDVSSHGTHGGCASQDKGRDGASKAQGQDGRDGESSSGGDAASQGQGRDGASSSNGEVAPQGQDRSVPPEAKPDRSVLPEAEPNSSLRELQTDYGLQFPLQDASDSDESLPPLSPLPPERVDCLHDVRCTDPLPSTRFPSLVDFSSSLVDLHSKMIDLLLREQQGHQDLSTARFQVAQVAAALNVPPSGGEPQHRVHQPGSR